MFSTHPISTYILFAAALKGADEKKRFSLTHYVKFNGFGQYKIGLLRTKRNYRRTFKALLSHALVTVFEQIAFQK